MSNEARQELALVPDWRVYSDILNRISVELIEFFQVYSLANVWNRVSEVSIERKANGDFQSFSHDRFPYYYNLASYLPRRTPIILGLFLAINNTTQRKLPGIRMGLQNRLRSFLRHFHTSSIHRNTPLTNWRYIFHGQHI